MERRTRSMVPETDENYLEVRTDALWRAKHEVWGSDLIKEYEAFGQALENKRTDLEKDEWWLEKVKTSLKNASTEEDRLFYQKLVEEREKQLSRNQEERASFQKRGERLIQFKLAALFREVLHDLLIRTRFEPDTERTDFLYKNVCSLLVDPGVMSEIKRYITGEYSLTNVVIGLSEIPAEILYRMLVIHQARMQEWKRRTEEFMENTKKEFFEAITREVQAGRLYVDLSLVETRLSYVVGKMADRLDCPDSRTLATHDANGVIRIYNSELMGDRLEYIRHLLFHELTHELAGRSIRIITEKTWKSVPERRVYDRKSGVQMRHDEGGAVITRRFRWLNEAITEWYALRLSGFIDEKSNESGMYKGSPCYIKERKELDRLFALGLPEKLVLAAYVENIHEEQQLNERGVAFAALLRKIREIETEPGAFERLEHSYAMREVESLLEDERIYTVEEDVSFEQTSPRGTLLYPITFSVGIQPRFRVTKSFYALEYPKERKDDPAITRSSKRDRLGEILTGVKNLTGGSRCRFSIGEPRTVGMKEDESTTA